MHSQGLTTIELLVTLLLAAILMAIGVPAFQSVLLNNRATSFAGDLMTYLNLARSEAIKRGQAVSLCAASSSDQVACATGTCSNLDNPDGNCWSNGWIVFVDNAMDGQFSDLNDRIRIREALASNQIMTMSNLFITYSAEGFVSAGSGDYLMTVPGCHGNAARLVQLSNVGRVSVTAAACGP